MQKQSKNRLTALFLVLTLTLSLLLSGCNSDSPISTELHDTPPSHVTNGRTELSRLADDYYAYINSQVLAAHDPEKSGAWSWFYDMDESARKQCREIIQDAASALNNDQTSATDPSVYKLGTLYGMATDQEGRDADGAVFFNELMRPVMEADTVQDFMNALASLQYQYGFDTLLNMEVLALDENPGEYAVLLKNMTYGVDAEELGYADSDSENRYYFTDYLGSFLTYYGYSESQAEPVSNQAYEFVKAVAASRKAPGDANYQPVSVEELQKILSNIDLPQVLSTYYRTQPRQFQVIDTAPIAKLNEFLTEQHLPMLKAYAYMVNLQKFSPFMTSDMAKLNETMEEEYIGDTDAKAPAETAADQVAALLKWDLGKLYAEKNYSAEKATDIQLIVSELLAEYKEMLKEEDWLSEETRQKALEKLDKINLRLGAPAEISQYLSAWQPISRQNGGSYFFNVLELRREVTQKQYDSFGQSVDRTVWNILPQELTPCYYPTDNSIYIPVAALEPPYFSVSATQEENLGAIGTIIGHEITHAFDDLGSKYDGNGDYVDWWTEADRLEFNAHAQKIVTYYNEYKTPGIMQQDGEYTLGENIADLGSMRCLTRIVEKNGLDAKKFFASYANSWASTSDGFTQALVSGMDEHAADKVRVNAVLSSCDLFYRTYDIKEGDDMYIAPEKRVSLW